MDVMLLSFVIRQEEDNNSLSGYNYFTEPHKKMGIWAKYAHDLMHSM